MLHALPLELGKASRCHTYQQSFVRVLPETNTAMHRKGLEPRRPMQIPPGFFCAAVSPGQGGDFQATYTTVQFGLRHSCPYPPLVTKAQPASIQMILSDCLPTSMSDASISPMLSGLTAHQEQQFEKALPVLQFQTQWRTVGGRCYHPPSWAHLVF